MKASNRGSDLAWQAFGFRRAAGLSFSDLHERSSPTGGSPPRRKSPPFGPTCGAPGGARRQNKILRRLFHAVILSAAVFLFMGAGDDSARFKDLGHRMMCACGCGQILLECNHVGCTYSDKMRNQLLAALDKGDNNNDDLILQGFVQEYGPTVIAAPTATGFNRVAWIMPFVVLALGIGFAVYIVRSWKNRPEPALADGIVIPHGRELDEFRRQARKETDL
jgi:cytochrome c-type biogenesis protein CcmH/NrfF